MIEGDLELYGCVPPWVGNFSMFSGFVSQFSLHPVSLKLVLCFGFACGELEHASSPLVFMNAGLFPCKRQETCRVTGPRDNWELTTQKNDVYFFPKQVDGKTNFTFLYSVPDSRAL